MIWLNEPPQWSQQENCLLVTTGDRTDFWNKTFYGFIHNNGHLRYREVDGNVSAQVAISADYSALYDQAGLMLLVDNDNWLKCGIEFTDGAMHFSTVVTRDGYSDWSQLALPSSARENFTVRLTRHDEALRVQFKTAGGPWSMARLAMLSMPGLTKVGMMCCSPTRAGLRVTFSDFAIGAAIARSLHD